MSKNSQPCLFCNPPKGRIVAENEIAYAMWDGFPVTEHHALITPKRHVEDYLMLNNEETLACKSLLEIVADQIKIKDPTVTAFNIGMNCGADAGQTIFHCHVHLIPRRQGDVEEPRGGIRHLIPGKGSY